MSFLALTLTLAVFAAGPQDAGPVVPGFERLHAAEGTSLRESGLLLLGELGCVNCHGATPAQGQWTTPRPAPVLDNLDGTLRPGWVQEFLEAPHAAAGTPMPDLLHGMDAADRGKAVSDLVAFLFDEPPLDSGAPVFAPKVVEEGEALYHQVGCVACHDPFTDPPIPETDDPFFDPDAYEPPEPSLASIGLPDLGRKFRIEALQRFLEAPHAHRPAARMPDMKLEPPEAEAIAAFLFEETSMNEQPLSLDRTASPGRGRELFQQIGCAACHTRHASGDEVLASKLDAPALTELHLQGGGCLSEKPSPSAAHYKLASHQRKALNEAVAFLQRASSEPPASTRLRQRLIAMNCVACHTYEGIGGPEAGRRVYFQDTAPADMGNEGRLPPPLDGAGAKLTPQWLRAILSGGSEIRPYMLTRMPDYGAEHGEALAALIIDAHAADLGPPGDTGLEHHHRSRYGRQLLGVNGLGCITCHDLNGRPAIGMPGTDLALAPDRLRLDWFTEYLLDPAGYRPQTRMPNFFPEGESTFKGLFGGHAVKQIEAIWTYLKEADVSRLPEGMEPEERYLLEPKDAPILHRTFMKGVGAHAIAVGFPESVHVAFDARNCRLALAWRGGFLSAESAWANRFTPFLEPLADDRIALSAGPVIAGLESPETPWPKRDGGVRFLGYVLDEDGAPTFHYRAAGADVEETITPLDNGEGLRRAWRIQGATEGLYLKVADSLQFETSPGGGFQSANNVRYVIAGDNQPTALIREADEHQELLLPMASGSQTITVQMTW